MKESVQRRLILNSYIEKYGEQNLRYYYFRVPSRNRCCFHSELSNHVVTAVTILHRDSNTVSVAFASSFAIVPVAFSFVVAVLTFADFAASCAVGFEVDYLY
jgi:hypothetical protein